MTLIHSFEYIPVQAFKVRVVTYRTGNDFYMSSEAMLFNRDAGAIFLCVGSTIIADAVIIVAIYIIAPLHICDYAGLQDHRV